VRRTANEKCIDRQVPNRADRISNGSDRPFSVLRPTKAPVRFAATAAVPTRRTNWRCRPLPVVRALVSRRRLWPVSRHSGPAANLPRTPLRFVPRRRSPHADVRRTPVRVDSRGRAVVSLPEPRLAQPTRCRSWCSRKRRFANFSVRLKYGHRSRYRQVQVNVFVGPARRDGAQRFVQTVNTRWAGAKWSDMHLATCSERLSGLTNVHSRGGKIPSTGLVTFW
jgi:hypothetical protein